MADLQVKPLSAIVKIDLGNIASTEQLKSVVAEKVATLQNLEPVTDSFSRDRAYAAITDAKKTEKWVGEERLKVTRILDAKKKEFTDLEKEIVKPITDAVAIHENKVRAYDAEVIRKRRAEEEAARIKQEEEQAEIRRQQQEAEKLRLEQQQAVEPVISTPDLEKLGTTTFMDDLEAEFANPQNNPFAKVPAKPVPVPVATAKPKGANTRWTYEIVEPLDVPLEYLVISHEAIKEAVKNGKREIRGVKIFEEVVTSFR